jgi:hypothetical protein
MRCGFINRGTMPAFTSDDLPDPLAPNTAPQSFPPIFWAPFVLVGDGGGT